MGEWRKSSYSDANGGQCVEARDDELGAVMVRDTTDRAGATLTFGAGAWAAFTAALRS
jgi:hypothetical protein